MTTISINIINNGASIGTVGYLAKNAAAIKLDTVKPLYPGDMRRGAWLINHAGDTITWLCDSLGDTVLNEPTTELEWTEAARDALADIVAMAEVLLENMDADAPKLQFDLYATTEK